MKLDDATREAVEHELKMAEFASGAIDRKCKQIESLRREIDADAVELRKRQEAAYALVEHFNDEVVFKFGDHLYMIAKKQLCKVSKHCVI